MGKVLRLCSNWTFCCHDLGSRHCTRAHTATGDPARQPSIPQLPYSGAVESWVQFDRRSVPPPPFSPLVVLTLWRSLLKYPVSIPKISLIFLQCSMTLSRFKKRQKSIAGSKWYFEALTNWNVKVLTANNCKFAIVHYSRHQMTSGVPFHLN